MHNNETLPTYTDADVKAALLRCGVAGTIYSLVMPESEAALSHVIDGCDRDAFLNENDVISKLDEKRNNVFFDRYREPWTQKQDAAHNDYFSTWLKWSAPVVKFTADDFPYRYPTAGASEGIFKIMAEYAAKCRLNDKLPIIHIFDGEYEGFPAYAPSLGIKVVRHVRDKWPDVAGKIEPHAQFWLSQPSAINGSVWPYFDAFVQVMLKTRPEVQIIPDLTYVGSVPHEFSVELDYANIPAFVISHSKPFGGYYHRVGGVFSRHEYGSLFGNKWFKNLASLAWATLMMERHAVFDLPRKYRPVQQAAVQQVSKLLDIEGFEPADVVLLGIAKPRDEITELLSSVKRGSGSDEVIRLCLTPMMTCMIDPDMAPITMSENGSFFMKNGI